jgi:hypothetical protein
MAGADLERCAPFVLETLTLDLVLEADKSDVGPQPAASCYEPAPKESP